MIAVFLQDYFKSRLICITQIKLTNSRSFLRVQGTIYEFASFSDALSLVPSAWVMECGFETSFGVLDPLPANY